MEESLKKLLIQGSKELAVELEENKLEQLMLYKDILKEWNEKINLTAIEEDKDVIIKHFIDSLTIIPYLNQMKMPVSLVDIGTGGGFPGIPVKISNKDIHVTLLDSLDKRVKFLNEVITRLDLKEIEAVHGRAEDYGLNPEYREKYDVATARAVASLPVLLEYCLPFVRVGGLFIAMKGSSLEEVEASKRALQILGGEIEDLSELTLPFTDMKRNIIIIRKLRHTSPKYPRKAGKPSRDPLI